MMIQTNKMLHRLKSQFSGFFVILCLCSCQPVSESKTEQQLMQQAKTDAAAAQTLANRRLVSQEYDSALYWFRHAALLGHTEALSHALELQQRQQGKLAAAQWLAAQLQQQAVSADTLPAMQLAELGLWSAIANRQQYSSPNYLASAGCALTLQPVASQRSGIDTWRQLLDDWQQDKQLSQLPVCYLPLLITESTELACTEQTGIRISCHYDVLSPIVDSDSFTQLVVISGKGLASYNNGIIQLPEQATLPLFRHEFMHILGFMDEYSLSPHTAASVCQPEHFSPNILFSPQGTSLDAYLKKWQLSVDDIRLTEVETCKTVGLEAYRVVKEVNLMRFYEAPLPDLYFRLMQQILKEPEQLMPVQYYFAYLARQQQQWHTWQRMMQHAASSGYEDAKQALSL